MNKDFTLKSFIAEIGVNHENSLEHAMRMIDECAVAGVGAVKFQSYKAKLLAAPHSPSYWDTAREPTTSQSELFSRYDKFGLDEFKALAEHCTDVGVEFMTTPFDVEYVFQLADLLARYKVASVDLTNKILLSAIAETRKPVIMSTGASSLEEVRRSVDHLMSSGVSDITLLHCVTKYPTPTAEAGLEFISVLKHNFPGIKVGYSDHTLPDDSQIVLLKAVALGAECIEKHYTFDKALPGNDHYHAFDANDLGVFGKNLEIFTQCNEYQGLGNQADAIQYARRGLYASSVLKAGHVLTENDVVPLRPQMHFLTPFELDSFIGKKLLLDVNEGDGLLKNHFIEDNR